MIADMGITPVVSESVVSTFCCAHLLPFFSLCCRKEKKQKKAALWQ